MELQDGVSRAEKKFRNEVEYKSLGKILRRDLKLLHMMGLNSIDIKTNDNDKKSNLWEIFVFWIGFTNMAIGLLFEIYAVVTIWGKDSTKAIVILASVLSRTLCIVKALRLWLCKDELRELLQRLNAMWEESKDRVRIREENTKTAMKTSYMGKIFIITVLSGCIIYAMKPYILLLHYHLYKKYENVPFDYTETILPGKFFWPMDTITKYIVCVTWEQFSLIFIGLYPLSTDILFAQLATHMAIQYRVLCHDLESLVDELNNNSRNERELINDLSNIAKRHHDLYTYCNTIQSVYNPIIFVTLTLTAADMCFCSYQMQKELFYRNWVNVMRSMVHGLVVTGEGFIYCTYADILTEQSSLMTQAAYNCQWMNCSKNFKIMLHIIMLRSQKPFNCSAYGLLRVNIHQMTRICKAAASYFTLLKTLT